MKIHYLIMFKLILSLFGCSRAPAGSTTSQAMGPFTIETITRHGTSFNMNYGRVKTTSISYEVKYKNEPLQFGEKLEVNTGLPGIWRVFYLKDAPRPTLLLGSQSLYLVTEENDKVTIKPVLEQNSDFASVQWLDSEAGQPGIYREIYSSDDADKDTELSGGRYMAMSRAAVLDVLTLSIYPFNTNNEQVQGYAIDQRTVIAFSPDSTQLAMSGYKRDEVDYNKTYYAIVVYDYKAGTSYAVPYSIKELYIENPSEFSSELFNDFFEWVKTDTSSLKLQLKKLDKPPYRRGRLVYERWPGYEYILNPVDSSMKDILTEFIREKTGLTKEQMIQDTDQYSNMISFTYKGNDYILQHGQYGSDLLLRCAGNVSDMKENQIFVTDLSKSFNALLNEGKYQDLFLEFPEENQY